jgi:hypothetical protein
MATRRNPPKKEPVLVRSHALTVSTQSTLNYLSHDATDYMGSEVSNSAIVRALIRYVDQHDTLWIRETSGKIVEEEMSRGTRWGKKKSE